MLARLANDPIDRIEPADPIDPMDSTDPTDPMESTEPTELIDNTDPRDPIDNTDDPDTLRTAELYGTGRIPPVCSSRPSWGPMTSQMPGSSLLSVAAGAAIMGAVPYWVNRLFEDPAGQEEKPAPIRSTPATGGLRRWKR